jgi:hypothetical protein
MASAAVITGRTRVSAHREWQGIHRLDRGVRLATATGQPPLPGSFELPEIGGLADKPAALRARGKEVAVMVRKIVEEVFIGLEFEVLATDFHRDDLGVTQFWRESGVADAVEGA